MIQTSFIQMKITKNSNANFLFKMIQIRVMVKIIMAKKYQDLNEEKKRLKINEDEGTRLMLIIA